MEADFANMRITHMEVVYPLLKIYIGNSLSLARIELTMNGFARRNVISEIPSPMMLTPGFFCAALTSEGIKRVRVLRMGNEPDTVLVRFCDYGFVQSISPIHLRVVQNTLHPPIEPELAQECWLAGVLAKTTTNASQITMLQAIIDVMKTIIIKVNQENLIKVIIHDKNGTVLDFGEVLVKTGLMSPVSQDCQLQLLHQINMSAVTPIQFPIPATDHGTSQLPTYETASLAGTYCPRHNQLPSLAQYIGTPRPEFNLPTSFAGFNQQFLTSLNSLGYPLSSSTPCQHQLPYALCESQMAQSANVPYMSSFPVSSPANITPVNMRSFPTFPPANTTPGNMSSFPASPPANTTPVNMYSFPASPPANTTPVNMTSFPTSPLANTVTPAAFKFKTLPVGTVQDVILHYIIDGLNYFAVHLKVEASGRLLELSNELKHHTPEPYLDQLFPGSVCLVKRDADLYRGIVSEISIDNITIYFVDVGNSDVVQINDIYQIPPKFLTDSAFAYRFSLANINRSYFLTTDEACVQFQQYLNKCYLRLKVTEPVLSSKQCCELYEKQGNQFINVADRIVETVRELAPTDYKKLTYKKNVIETVVVSCKESESPAMFHVQRVTDLDASEALCEELTELYENNNIDYPDELTVGVPVGALFDGDELWYRALVISEVENSYVGIEFVDFGNTDMICCSDVRYLSIEHINRQPKLATGCRLKKKFEITMQLLETFYSFVGDEPLSMWVMDIVDGILVVDLFDDENRSVIDVLESINPSPISNVNLFSPESRRENAVSRDKRQRKISCWNNMEDPTNEDSHENVEDSEDENRKPRCGSDGYNGRNNQDLQIPGCNKNSAQEDVRRSYREETVIQSWQIRFDYNHEDKAADTRDASDDGKRGWDCLDSDDNESSWNERRGENFRQGDNQNYGARRDGSSYRGSRSNSNDQTENRPFVSQLDDEDKQNYRLTCLEIQAGAQMDVEVTWFSNPNKFFVMKLNNYEFNKMMKDMQTHYPKRKEADYYKLKAGSYVAVRSSDDVIYRAKILEKCHNGLMMVLYVDFGNRELVSRHQVWRLDKRHSTLPRQVVMCDLQITPAGDDWPATETMSAYFEENRYATTFVSYDDKQRLWMVKLTGENGDIAKKMIADGIAARPVVVLESEEPYDMEFLRGQFLSVNVCLVEGIWKFFVNLEMEKVMKIEKEISALQDEAYVLQSLPLERIKVGEYCLAPTNDDWCRARILSIDERMEIGCVLNIDNGDQYFIYFDQMMYLPESLSIYNAQATECCIVNADELEDRPDFIDDVCYNNLIMKVEDVVSNKLITRLFDFNGHQLPYPEPSSVKIPTICPFMVLRHRELVRVSHVTTKSVFLQRVSDGENLRKLALKVKASYSNSESDYKEPEGACRYYAVKSALFKGWYRARLIKENKVVYYIDYGTEEPKLNVELMVPLNLHHVYPEYCLAVTVPSVKIASDADLKPLLDSVTGLTFVALLERDGDGWSASLRTTDGVLFGEYVKIAGVGVVVDAATDVSTFDEWSLDDTMVTCVSHAPSPSTVHLQRSEDRLALEALQDAMNSAMPQILPLVGPPEVDALYATKINDKWYRVAASSETVTAVDYGFSFAAIRLFKLPTALAVVPPYSVMCETNIEPLTAEWSVEAKTRFNKLVNQDEAVVAHYDAIMNNMRIVDLSVNGKSVLESLVKENLARWRRYSVTISHANSLAEFYVQAMNDTEFDTITNTLAEAAQWDDIQPVVDDMVAAKFEDGEWYRAIVMERTDDAAIVRFVDFGNVSTCKEFKRLRTGIKQKPFCVRCSLHPLPQNVNALNDKFVNFTWTHDAFDICFLLRGKTTLCQLYYENEPIIEVLSKTEETDMIEAENIEQVTICYINSPSSFYVHNENELMSLKIALSDQKEATPSRIDIGDLVAAKFPQDDVWYRARVLSILEDGVINVFFIDYGNESTVTMWHRLPYVLHEPEPLALHCAFRLPTSLVEWPRYICSYFSKFCYEGPFVLRRLEKINDVTHVDLLNNGASMAEELVTLCHADIVTSGTTFDPKKTFVTEIQRTGELPLQYDGHKLNEKAAEMRNAESGDEIFQVETGDLVAAKYIEDGLWYQVKIVGKSEFDYEILFLNYGKQSQSSVDRALTAHSASSLPAYLCRLPIKELMANWSVQKLHELTDTHKFVVQFTEEVSTESMTLVSSPKTSDLTKHLREDDNCFKLVRKYDIPPSKFNVQSNLNDLEKVEALRSDVTSFETGVTANERMVPPEMVNTLSIAKECNLILREKDAEYSYKITEDNVLEPNKMVIAKRNEVVVDVLLRNPSIASCGVTIQNKLDPQALSTLTSNLPTCGTVDDAAGMTEALRTLTSNLPTCGSVDGAAEDENIISDEFDSDDMDTSYQSCMTDFENDIKK